MSDAETTYSKTKNISRIKIYLFGFFLISILVLFIVFGFELSIMVKHSGSPFLDSLDLTIKNRQEFTDAKYLQINTVKQQLNTPDISPEQLYQIDDELFYMFKTFICDSAFHYAKEKMRIAESLQKQDWIDDSKLNLASVYYIVGMYKEAFDTLHSIDEVKLDNSLKINYYNNYKEAYAYYSFNNIYASQYKKISDAYRDTLLSILEPKSNHYLIVYAEKLKDEGKLSESKQILTDLLAKSSSENHEYAILNYAIADICRKEGNDDLAKEYLASSADADLKNAIKENAAMQTLAVLLYGAGDLNHAYEYIKCSLEDAMFCNAHVRTIEISKIFPIIDTAYQEKSIKQKNQLKFYLLLTTVLSFFLIMTVIFIYKQMNKLSAARKEIHDAYWQLNDLNKQLQQTNNRLEESNEIKDQYVIQSLYGKSEYIERFDKLLKKLHTKIIAKQFDDLGSLYYDTNIKMERENMFSSFDKTFLLLFPNFIEEYNKLFAPADWVTVDENGNFSPELRIFALMRLGITENERIAGFLNIAVTTVYSYKSKAKAKTIIPKEDFERRIMAIKRTE